MQGVLGTLPAVPPQGLPTCGLTQSPSPRGLVWGPTCLPLPASRIGVPRSSFPRFPGGSCVSHVGLPSLPPFHSVLFIFFDASSLTRELLRSVIAKCEASLFCALLSF